MKNNRVVIVVIAVVLALAFILNPTSVFQLVSVVNSLASTTLCIVAIIFLLKHL